MKYIKLFENAKFYELQNTIWYIKGDVKEVLYIFDKFVKEYNIPKNKIYFVENLKYEKNILGVYMSFNETINGAYYRLDDYKDLINAREYYIDIGYIYQGELKIIDDKLFLDTFDNDVNKYNL